MQEDEQLCRDDDFRAYLQKTVSGSSNSQLERLEEVFSEPNRTLVEHVKSFKTEMESSFEKERSGMECRFKNEKNDILKGFLIEKKILSQEHEAEKNSLLHSFVKERQKMLDTFEQQVKDIETDLLHKQEFRREPKLVCDTKQKTEKKKIIYHQSETESRKMDGHLVSRHPAETGNHMDDVMRDVSLEKKMICQHEKHEQDYYRKLERIKEELEGEFNLNLRREREKKESHVAALQKEIDSLKSIKCSVADTWKEQASKLEEEFQRERNELGRHFKDERDKLRRKLEEKNEMKLDAQKQEYDESIGKLKTELQRIKCDAMKKGQEATNHSIQAQNDLIRKLQDNFELDTRVIREQNDKLTEDIKVLTSEKYEQSRQIRELHDKLERETKSGTEMSTNMKKEFSTKMKCLLSDNEKLKHTVKNLETEKDTLNRKLRSCCRSAKDNVEKLSLSERTIAQCEDTVTSMRNENKNLSHEITLLRKEKDDLLHKIDAKLELERTLSLDISRLQTEIKDWCNKYALLEREKLQNEKLVAKIRKEADTHLSNFTQVNNKLSAFESETNKLRQLYENERKENIRLHQRFTQDAELIREKEAENVNTRTLLNKIKTEFEGLKGKMEYDNEKIMQIESEKHSLENMVQKLKSAESVHVKHEILAVQNKYVKEFAKRLDYVKKNYEREIQQLKIEVKELRKSGNKQSEVGKETRESIQCEKSMCNDVGEHNQARYLSSHVCTEVQCNHVSVDTGKEHNMFQQPSKGDSYNIPHLGNVPKVAELYLDGETTSSSNGDTISSGELPTRDWEVNDTCETVINCGPTHMTKKNEQRHAINSNEFAQYDTHGYGVQSSTHIGKKSSPFAQTKSINSAQNCHMSPTLNQSKPNSKHHEKRTKITLPARPTNDGIAASKKKSQSCHVNSETSSSTLSEYSGVLIKELVCRMKKQNSEQSNTTEDINEYLNELMSRVQNAENHSDCEELRILLRDVTDEVMHLNKVMETQSPSSSSPPTFANPDRYCANATNVVSEAKYKLEQHHQNGRKPVVDHKEGTKKDLSDGSAADISFDEIYKRRSMLENLVNYLQNKLRDETAKGLQCQQQNNGIKETSKEVKK